MQEALQGVQAAQEGGRSSSQAAAQLQGQVTEAEQRAATLRRSIPTKEADKRAAASARVRDGQGVSIRHLVERRQWTRSQHPGCVACQKLKCGAVTAPLPQAIFLTRHLCLAQSNMLTFAHELVCT